MRHGIRKEIAIKVGISPQHMGAILNGKCRPGLALTSRLEAETGIAMKVWALASTDELNAAMSEKYPKKK